MIRETPGPTSIASRILLPATVIWTLAAIGLALASQPDARALAAGFGCLVQAWHKSWAGGAAFSRAIPGHMQAVLAAAAILGVAWAWGGRCLGILARGRAAPAHGITRAGLGLGCMALAVLGLALCGLLVPALLLAVGLCGVVAGPRPSRTPASSGRGPETAVIARVAWSAAGFLLLTDLAASLCPEWFADGQMYHLGLPERFLLDRKFAPAPENLLTFLPLNTEMLYAVALAFGGEEGAKILNWCWGGMLALAAAALARELCGRAGAGWAGGLAAFALVSMPLTMVENEIAFGDNFRALVETLALLWAVRAIAGSRSALLVAAAFLGIAMGSKYLSVFRGGLVGAGVLLLGAGAWRRRAGLTAVLVLACASVLFPWLARNWLVGGDPVYPFLQGIFTPLRFTGEDLARWMQDNEHYGIAGQTAGSWAGTLWRAAVSPGDAEFGTFALSPLVVGLLPLLFLPRRWPRSAALVLAVVAGETLAWSLTSHLVRYLLPALVAGCALAGWLVARVDEDSPRFARLIATAVLVWALPVLVMRMHHRCNANDIWGTFGHALGRYGRGDALDLRGFGGEMRELPPGTVLLVGEDRVLGIGRRWRGGSIYDRTLVKEWAEASAGPRRFLVRVRQAGVRAVILNGGGFNASQSRGRGFRLTDRELAVVNPWWKSLHVVYRKAEWTGYSAVHGGGGTR